MASSSPSPSPSSATQLALGARLQTLEPGSPRYRVVAAAQKFKASWLELAQHLTDVRGQKRFAGWGYASFSAYCRQELHIKQETADKLTRSYGYLRERAPAVLEASAAATQALPPLDVVDLLSQARGRTTVSGEAWDSLEGEVLAGETGANRSQLLKRLREVDPDTFAPKPSAADGPSRPTIAVDAHSLRKVLLLAERLEDLLRGMAGGVDAALLASAETCADGLRRQVDAAAAQTTGNDGGLGSARRKGGEARSAHLPPGARMQ